MVTTDHEGLEDIAEHALDFTQHLLGAQGSFFTCFDDRTGVHITANGVVASLKGQSVSLDSSALGQVFFSGCGRLYGPHETTQIALGAHPNVPILSSAVAPIHAQGHVVAALSVVSTRKGFFSARELKILQVIAYNVGQRFGDLPSDAP